MPFLTNQDLIFENNNTFGLSGTGTNVNGLIMPMPDDASLVAVMVIAANTVTGTAILNLVTPRGSSQDISLPPLAQNETHVAELVGANRHLKKGEEVVFNIGTGNTSGDVRFVSVWRR